MKLKSHFLTTILTPALRIWLKSQLDSLTQLQLEIKSSDQQLLQGMIPKVLLKSELAIYKGLHFDQISLIAEQLQVNIHQILKGQSLQLLHPLPISGKIRITQAHLNDSLSSSLLQSGLQDFLASLLKNNSFSSLQWKKITLQSNQFLLEGKLLHSLQDSISIQANVDLTSPQHLLISPIAVQGFALNQEEITPVEFDLGSQVYLQDLKITQEAIFLEGRIIISDQ
ncbi:MAG: DUF2993 domain-containing protein [Halothece sp.]